MYLRVRNVQFNRTTKQALQYRPKRRKNIRRPRKSWRANFFTIKEEKTRRTLYKYDDDELLPTVYAFHKFKIYMVVHTSFSQKCVVSSNSDVCSAVAGILHTDKSLKRLSELSGRYDQSKPYAKYTGTNETINEA